MLTISPVATFDNLQHFPAASISKKQSWISEKSLLKLSLTTLLGMKQWKSKTKLASKTQKQDLEVEEVSDGKYP